MMNDDIILVYKKNKEKYGIRVKFLSMLTCINLLNMHQNNL